MVVRGFDTGGKGVRYRLEDVWSRVGSMLFWLDGIEQYIEKSGGCRAVRVLCPQESVMSPAIVLTSRVPWNCCGLQKARR
jgi:hypothetical protein